MDYLNAPFSLFLADISSNERAAQLQIRGSIREKGWKSGSLRLSLVFHLDAPRSSIFFQRRNIKEMSLFPDKKKKAKQIVYTLMEQL